MSAARTLGLLFLCAVLAGCTQYWEKPGGTEAEFRDLLPRCRSYAAAQFPPFIQLVQEGYFTPDRIECTRFPNGARSCVTYPGHFVPPVYSDLNEGPRIEAVDSCLVQNGWNKVK